MRDVGTLLEALPYIREFHAKTVVIKYGGAAMEDPALREEFARDVVLLKYVGLNPIVVHGGGPEITAYMERLGLPVEFVGGLRVSDEDTVEVAKMVLVGKVNKEIVLRLSRHGQPAVGLCGDDGSLFRVARRAAPGRRGHRLRRAHRARQRRRDRARRKRLHPRDRLRRRRPRGHSYNVNADEAAGAVAGALGAYKVDVPHRRARLAARPRRPRQPDRAGHRRAGGGGARGPRRAACARSSRPAWRRSTAASARRTSSTGAIAHSLLLELFTDAGIGTKIEAAA